MKTFLAFAIGLTLGFVGGILFWGYVVVGDTEAVTGASGGGFPASQSAEADRAAGAPPEAGAVGPCAVTYVIDGDTVEVDCPGSGRDKIRLLRIDTPERGDPGYEEATTALASMALGRDVYLVFEKPGLPVRGGYGRLLAYLFADGVNLNVEMVRLGWSPFWREYGSGRFAREFEAAQREATANR